MSLRGHPISCFAALSFVFLFSTARAERGFATSEGDGLRAALHQGGGGGARYDTRLPFALLKEHVDLTRAPVFASVKGTITYMKAENPLMYPACPKMTGDRQCNKKLVRGARRQGGGATLPSVSCSWDVSRVGKLCVRA
jgi:hypothetical protein